MTGIRVLRLASAFGLMLLASACTSPVELQGSNRDVARRMQVRMAPDLAAGQATLYAAPNSTTVTLPEKALFAPSAAQLDENGRLVLARFMQGLLKPEITRIEVAGPPAASWTLQAARVQAVRAFFVQFGLGSTLQPATVAAPSIGAVPDSITIAVQVVWS